MTPSRSDTKIKSTTKSYTQQNSEQNKNISNKNDDQWNANHKYNLDLFELFLNACFNSKRAVSFRPLLFLAKRNVCLWDVDGGVANQTKKKNSH